jgi:hypothetical protein
VEAIGVAEADAGRLAAPHGQAGDGAGGGVAADAIGGFDKGDDILEQVFLEKAVLLFPVRAWIVKRQDVAERHHDKSFGGFAFGKQVVEDEVGAADVDPAAVVVAGAVEQVQDRVPPDGAGIAGRRVDVQTACRAGGLRAVVVDVDRAVGDVPEIVKRRGIARDLEHTGGAPHAGLDSRVMRVDRGDAVDRVGVVVNLGFQRTDGERPDTVVLADEILLALVPARVELHLAHVGAAEPERDAAVGMNLRGPNRGFGSGPGDGWLGEGETRQQTG